jgi:hypothetical protein
VAQVAFVDSQGREWREVVATTGLAWNAVATVCPQDGTTPCSGVVEGKDMTGWIWATREQVRAMMVEFVPDLASQDSVAGGSYTLAGLSFTGTFDPTYSSYTTFGASFSVAALTSSKVTPGGATVYAPNVAAGYNPNTAAFTVAATVGAGVSSQYTGVWMFRVPVPPCPSDIDGSGVVDAADLGALLGAWGSKGGSADINGDGTVDAADLSALLGAWGGC